jgi:protein Tob/BTG
MKSEIDSAANFITSLLRSRKELTEAERDRFSDSLRSVMATRYSDHWFPDKPFKGSGFRCIRIVKRRIDPVLALAASAAGINEDSLLNVLPSELTLWVDPDDVCYRFGEDGSIGSLFGGGSSESDSDDSSSSSSFCSLPPSPPSSVSCVQDFRHKELKHSTFVERSTTTAIAV